MLDLWKTVASALLMCREQVRVFEFVRKGTEIHAVLQKISVKHESEVSRTCRFIDSECSCVSLYPLHGLHHREKGIEIKLIILLTS